MLIYLYLRIPSMFYNRSFAKLVFVTVIFFFQDYERSLRQLSLDDIERLAGRLLHPDGEGMDTSYMDWRCSAASPLLWLWFERGVFRVWDLHLTVCVVLLRSGQLISWSADRWLSERWSYWLLLITAMGLSCPQLRNWMRTFNHFFFLSLILLLLLFLKLVKESVCAVCFTRSMAAKTPEADWILLKSFCEKYLCLIIMMVCFLFC